MEPLTLAFGVVAILLTILSIYLGFKALRKRKPRWAIRTTSLNLQEFGALGRVQLTYDGNPVPNVAVSKLLFWNKGSETIRKEDVAQASPIRIVARDDTRILDVQLLAENNDSSAFEHELADSGGIAWLKFDYIDRDQGAVFHVVHTGTSSESIAFEGRIMGVGKPKRVREPATARQKLNFRLYMLYTLSAILALFLIAIIIESGWAILVEEPNVLTSTSGGLLLMGVIFLIIEHFTTQSVPKGLEVFAED